MSYVSQQTLRAALMSYLFAAAQTDRAGRDIEEMRAIFRVPIGERRIQIAIDELESDELAEDIGEGGKYEYALTAEGYESAEKLYMNKENKNFKDLADQLIEKLQGTAPDNLIIISSDENRIPASDRFVEFGHNTSGYQEVVSSVEEAVEAIRQSNSLPPDDRSWIQANLEIGLTALRKGGKLLADGVKTFALEPLKAALTGVTEEKLKTVIGLAISTLRNFLGL